MKTIFFILVLFITATANGTVYHVAASGGDFSTITAVNAATFSPDDQILFNRGEIYTGTLIISNSGTAGHPIVYGAYGTGANPIITGFTTVNAWTNLGSNNWESTNAVSSLSSCNVVSTNGINTAMGRTPNAGTVYTLQSHSANASLTSSNLTGTPDWTGAEIVIRKERWIWQRAVVTSQSGSTVNFTDIESASFSPRDTWGFFFQDDVRTLDQQNEWYYNPAAKKINVYSATEPTNVKVSTTDYNLTATSKSYITIENIDFEGANESNLSLTTCTNIIIQNCSISFSGKRGINCSDVDNSEVTACHIFDCNNAAVLTDSTCSNFTIQNNIIERIGLLPGMTLVYTSGIQSYANSSIISNNNISNIGYDGIFVGSTTLTIRNNFINNTLQSFGDGGGIYTAGSKTRVLIVGNIVLNTKGDIMGVGAGGTIANGIYLDYPSVNVTVDSNTTAYNTDEGVFVNYGSSSDTVMNNICFANEYAQFASHNYTGNSAYNLSGVVITGNQFVAKSSTGYSIEIRSALNDIPSWGLTTNHNIYSRPIDNTNTLFIGQPDTYTGGLQYKTLAEWRSFFGQDVNSSVGSASASADSDLDIIYNDTNAAKFINTQWPARNINGVYIGTTIQLQPYTSLVVYREYSPPISSTNSKVAGKNGKALLNLRTGKIIPGKN